MTRGSDAQDGTGVRGDAVRRRGVRMARRIWREGGACVRAIADGRQRADLGTSGGQRRLRDRSGAVVRRTAAHGGRGDALVCTTGVWTRRLSLRGMMRIRPGVMLGRPGRVLASGWSRMVMGDRRQRRRLGSRKPGHAQERAHHRRNGQPGQGHHGNRADDALLPACHSSEYTRTRFAVRSGAK